MGIVNGTCNYVITRLEQDELPLAQAVAEAQALGLAEADPSADLDGHDAAAKLSILAYRAFGAWVRPDGFAVRGVRELDPADCDLAEAMGFRIRLIARAARVGGALDLAVEPMLLPDWHLLASVEEEYNAVYLKCASSGDLSLFGKGAGALPTATAVLGDLIDLAQDNSVRWPVPQAIPVAAAGGRDPAAAAPPLPAGHRRAPRGAVAPGRQPGPARGPRRPEPGRARRGRAPPPRVHGVAQRSARGSSGSPPRSSGSAGSRTCSCSGSATDERRRAGSESRDACPGRAPAAGRDGRRDPRPPRRARRATPAPPGCHTCTPTTRRSSSTCSARPA